MNTDTPTRTHRDRGAVLPLALILTLVLGAVVAAIATYTATALRTTQVTESRVDRLAAAETGMQIALTQVETSGTCPTALAPIDSIQLEVTSCTSEPVVSADALQTYGMALTRQNLDAGIDAFGRSGNTPIQIGGEVFVELGVGATSPTSNVFATGNVLSRAEICPDTGRIAGPTWLGVADSECTTQRWFERRQPPALPAVGGNAVSSVPGCDVRTPTTYTSNVTISDSTPTYFASGVYIVRQRLELRGFVTAGYNASPASRLPDAHPCRPAQAQDEAGALRGVAFVLEGNGHLEISGNSANVSIFGLATGSAPTQRVVALAAYHQPFGGFQASTRHPNGNGPGQQQPVIDKSSAQGSFGFEGEVWAPAGFVNVGSIPSNAPHSAVFRGGLTVSRLLLNTSAQVTGLVIGSGDAVTEDQFLIRVRATSPGGASTEVSTVSRITNDGPLRVQSWRVL